MWLSCLVFATSNLIPGRHIQKPKPKPKKTGFDQLYAYCAFGSFCLRCCLLLGFVVDGFILAVCECRCILVVHGHSFAVHDVGRMQCAEQLVFVGGFGRSFALPGLGVLR